MVKLYGPDRGVEGEETCCVGAIRADIIELYRQLMIEREIVEEVRRLCHSPVCAAHRTATGGLVLINAACYPDALFRAGRRDTGDNSINQPLRVYPACPHFPMLGHLAASQRWHTRADIGKSAVPLLLSLVKSDGFDAEQDAALLNSIKNAVENLSVRKRAPMLKNGLSVEEAVAIGVGGLPYAKLISACTAEIDVSDKNTNAKLAENYSQAAITAAQITKLCRLLAT